MLTPDKVTEKFLSIGKTKTTLPLWKMFLLGLAAGIYIALAGVACTQMNALLGGGAGKILGACVFPMGLILVVIAGSELFTGNCLISVSVLQKEVKISAMLKNWGVVYVANFLGGLLVAAAVALLGGISAEAFRDAAIASATAKATLTFGQAFVRGILCNILVCLAVWVATAAETAGGKIAGLYLPIAMFVLCGYEHSIANMYFLPAGLFYAAQNGIASEGLTWANAFCNNLIPVSLGNIVGGCFIGVLYALAYRRSKAEK